MGSAASKAAKTAASTAPRRQYPQRIPPNPSTTPKPSAGEPTSPAPSATPGPTVHPKPQASGTKDESISLDAADPDFAASLRSLGPVQPNSTLSNTSTFHPSPPPQPDQAPTSFSSRPSASQPLIFPDPAQNPALAVLTARSRLVEEAEREFSRVRVQDGGGEGRRFLDVGTLRTVLVMRDEKGIGEREIEKQLGLSKGVVRSLGRVGNVRVGDVDAGDSGIY